MRPAPGRTAGRACNLPVMQPAARPRRSCLAVPGSSPRFIAKARGLDTDEVFLDLEDAVAPAAKPPAPPAVGQADFMASLGMRSLDIGAQPAGYAGGDAFHYPLLRLLVAARAHGLQAIDGPYAAIADTEGLARAAASVAALGFDGKWVLHPGQ